MLRGGGSLDAIAALSTANTVTSTDLLHADSSESGLMELEELPFVDPPQAPSLAGIRKVRVLYLFAGAARRSDVHHFLAMNCDREGFQLTIKEIDLLRHQSHDVTDDVLWRQLMDEIRAGLWDVLVCTPPCNTHSRARYSSRPGPPPLRAKRYPWGFPWLSNRNKEACELGNLLIRLTLECCALAHEHGCAFLIEHPEDLGSTAVGDQPGSIWAMNEFVDLMKS